MKKQLQKTALLFFLSGCMIAPVNHFSSYFKTDRQYNVPFGKIVLVSDLKNFDSEHHIENKLSQSPKQIIQNWIDHTLITKQNAPDLHIILHQTEIVRQEFPAKHWWQPDMIQDTLNYKIELVQRGNAPNQNRLNIGGKHYVKMNKKTSLAQKEKEYAKLYHQMLKHLESEIQNNIHHVIPVSSPN